MKMDKASERDINAAGDAMSVLSDISSGYYPKRDGDECKDMFFDEEDPKHLRKFYDLMNATLEAAQGWPTRVIGGMCYVILFDKNRIVDPDADVLELHPRFAQADKERDELLAALKEARRWIGDGECSDGLAREHWTQEYRAAVDRIDAAIAKVTGEQT